MSKLDEKLNKLGEETIKSQIEILAKNCVNECFNLEDCKKDVEIRVKIILTEAFKAVVPEIEVKGKHPLYDEGNQDGQNIMRGKITDALKKQFGIDLEDR